MSTTIGTNGSAAYKAQVLAGANSPAASQLKLGNMFQQIDTAGTGRISKTQFDQSFGNLNLPASVKGMGKEAVFGKLDPSDTGTVTKQDFIKGMESLMTQKPSSRSKGSPTEAKVEVKQAPAPAKASEKAITDQTVASDKPPTTDGWSIGYIINTTA